MPDTTFSVFGLKQSGSLDDPTVELVPLGAFDTREQAEIFREIHNDIDSTFDAFSIQESPVFEEVPEMDIFLLVHFEGSNLIVDSKCLEVGFKPLLVEEEEIFESIAYPEDREKIVNRAVSWFKKKYGSFPTVVDRVSPVIESYNF